MEPRRWITACSATNLALGILLVVRGSALWLEDMARSKPVETS